MSAIKIRDMKPEDFVFDKVTVNKEYNFTRHFLKYKGDTGESKNGKFKLPFKVSFPMGLRFDTSEGGDYQTLKGKMVLDLEDPKVKEFVDNPNLGSVQGWVREKDVEQVEFHTFKAKKEISFYEEASKDSEKGTIPEGTMLRSDEKEDGFYHVTYGGGKSGTLHKMIGGIAKTLWKNRKASQIKLKRDFKSEKDLENTIKFPIKFSTDEKGNVGRYATWNIKVSHMEDRGDKKGFHAQFTVPGMRDLTLDEMCNKATTGKPCITFSNLFVSSDKCSLQFYFSSMVVSDISEVVYENPQQEEIDELAGDAEHLAKMKDLLPELPPPSKGKGKKEGKDKKKEKKKKKKVESESESEDEEPSDVKSIIKPSLEKVNENLDSDSDLDSDVPGAKDDSEEEEEKPKKKKEVKPDSDSEEEEKPKKKEKKKKEVKPDSDEEEEKKKEVKPDSDEEEEKPKEKEKKKDKKEKKKKVEVDSDDSD